MSLRRANDGYGQLSLMWTGGFIRGLGQARCVGQFVVEVGFELLGDVPDNQGGPQGHRRSREPTPSTLPLRRSHPSTSVSENCGLVSDPPTGAGKLSCRRLQLLTAARPTPAIFAISATVLAWGRKALTGRSELIVRVGELVWVGRRPSWCAAG
jgi:hypothetical protein